MKKKAELLQKINALRTQVIDLLKANNMDEAKTKNDELTALMAEYDKTPEDAAPKAKGATTMSKEERMKNVRMAVNAYLHRGYNGLTDEQKGILKPTNSTDTPGQVETVNNRGGVLVPVETADFVARMATGVYRLRTRTDEYFARTKSGKIPLVDNPTSGLVAQFDEYPAGGISKGQITFGSADFNVRDYGLIVPVSNDLLADAEADVYGVIMEQFIRAQVITENSLILAAIDGNGDATEVTGWQDILKELNGTDPVGAVDKVIVTNTDGYNYLDTLTDDQGRPILTQALVDNPRRIFRGYEVIQLPNASLATVEGAIPFYVGSLRDAVYLVERQGLTFSYNPYSDSAYSKNATDIRVTCRLDCVTKFASAVKKLTYTPSEG